MQPRRSPWVPPAAADSFHATYGPVLHYPAHPRDDDKLLPPPMPMAAPAAYAPAASQRATFAAAFPTEVAAVAAAPLAPSNTLPRPDRSMPADCDYRVLIHPDYYAAPSSTLDPTLEAALPAVPTHMLLDFDHGLEADVKTVAVTLLAAAGVVMFWRGVWDLLDFIIPYTVLGDACCLILGVSIVVWIRLSGAKMSATFWPPS